MFQGITSEEHKTTNAVAQGKPIQVDPLVLFDSVNDFVAAAERRLTSGLGGSGLEAPQAGTSHGSGAADVSASGRVGAKAAAAVGRAGAAMDRSLLKSVGGAVAVGGAAAVIPMPAQHAATAVAAPPQQPDASAARLIAAQRKQQLIARSTLEQLQYLAVLYSPYTFYKCRFGTANTEALFQALNDQEKKMFDFDLKRIDWLHYLVDVHIPGLRKYVLKGRST